MVRRDLHVQSGAAVSEIFGSEDSTLFTDEESSLSITLASSYTSNQESNKSVLFALTEKVLQPTLSGQILRSETFKFLTP